MRSLAVLLQYEGTAFAGWQYQPGQRTVQGEVEAALEKIMDEPVKVLAAGRTDAGVHAAGQVISFRTGGTVPVDRLAYALNANLPGDVSALSASEVGPEFHATRSALGKVYVYALWTASTCSPFLRRYVSHLPAGLNVQAMQEAGSQLVGTHDFRAFQSSGSSARSWTRTVTSVAVEASGPLVTITVAANGFLYNMARIIAGTLMQVGTGRREVEGCFEPALTRGERGLLGPTAPAQGLWLARAEYPPPLGRILDPHGTMSGLSALTGHLAAY
ncbi:MAG: tRNA pseudouridine(38-40) synthase TruA [Bacillota bacterium]